MARAHRVIAVSEHVRGRLGGVQGNIEVVPNIVETRPASVSSDATTEPGLPESYLLAVGKLSRAKGFDRIVDELVDADARLPLLVAGAGPAADHMRQRAAERGLDLRLFGWTDGELTRRLMRDATAVVLPSAWEEPLARVLLESMSVGTPVIARATGGTPEVIDDGGNGWLFTDRGELAKALRAIGNPEQRARAGGMALATARQRYAPDVVYPRLAAVYEAALREAGLGG